LKMGDTHSIVVSTAYYYFLRKVGYKYKPPPFCKFISTVNKGLPQPTITA
jgi:hypothetical protein